ncbi:hypothetical protein ebA5280 [Aromatoleum aromaticum EbN1]|uniref:Uncharacterized protein n=1 Tax=Aromatoleum aromaticum (strain DSM 19018 / LMG 30748 / EbN1) TaxID=76114 RepID=Q5P0P1_AROAE|nr:hypothetical protein ebA5280 [Aromatoleum aromaticum EbN1]
MSPVVPAAILRRLLSTALPRAPNLLLPSRCAALRPCVPFAGRPGSVPRFHDPFGLICLVAMHKIACAGKTSKKNARECSFPVLRLIYVNSGCTGVRTMRNHAGPEK